MNNNENNNEQIEEMDEDCKNFVEKLRENNPQISEEEINLMIRLYKMTKRSNLRTRREKSKISLFRFLRNFLLKNIIFMALFGLFSSVIEFKEWYFVFLYSMSLSVFDALVGRILWYVRAVRYRVIYRTIIAFVFVYCIMVLVNRNTNYFVFNNLFTMFLFLIIWKILYYYIDIKMMIWKLSRNNQ